jgi:hypothetical protein
MVYTGGQGSQLVITRGRFGCILAESRVK